MIESAILEAVLPGIASIGYMRQHWKTALNPASETGADLEIVGTGFLIGERILITNRHVVQGLEKARTDFKLDDQQLWLSFVFQSAPGFARIFVKIDDFTYSNNPALDIGFVDFRLKPPELEPARPLVIGALSDLRVGQPIAVCGYPYGTEMLRRDGREYRFGPVLQQGYISALSPYHGASHIEELLLDVRAAGGMSGSPVFLPNDGTVIGILYEGLEATTALAIPLSAEKVERWLSEHARAKSAKDNQ